MIWKILLIILSIQQGASAQATLTWARGPDLVLPRGGYYAAVHRGGIVIAGGTYWRDDEKFWTDRVDFYDPKSGTWTQWPSLPESMAYGGMVRVENNLYLMAGGNATNPQRKVFKLVEERWVPMGKTPAPRFYASVVTSGSTIYLIAGGSSMVDLDRCSDEVWAFDVSTEIWRALEPIPGPPRVIQTAAVLESALYVFGGCTKEPGRRLRNLDDAYRLDMKSWQWTKLASTPVATRAWWAEPVQGSIYLSGGYGDTFQDTVYCYNPEEDDYSLISQFDLGLADTKFLQLNSTFYGISGEDGGRSRFPGLLIGRFPPGPVDETQIAN